MEIVVKDRRFGLQHKTQPKYIIDYTRVSANIPLASTVLKQYKITKSNLGYATFRNLRQSDVESILSAVKRHKAILGMDRWGRVSSYKLKEGY